VRQKPSSQEKVKSPDRGEDEGEPERWPAHY